jgi:hypothetical protein
MTITVRNRCWLRVGVFVICALFPGWLGAQTGPAKNTPRQLEKELPSSKLRRFISEPEVTVPVTEDKNQNPGQVARPGSYPLTNSSDALDEVSKVKCLSEVPKDFACAILFDFDSPPIKPPLFVLVIREVDLILDGTLYAAVYDPPLEAGDNRPVGNIWRNMGVPARVVGDDLFVIWLDGKETKAKIIRREKINPNRPQPA